MFNRAVCRILILFTLGVIITNVVAQRPEFLLKESVYEYAWDDSHFGTKDSPFYQATIDRSGVAPYTGSCENPITVVAEVAIIEGLMQFHPSTTVKLSRPLTPGRRYYADFDASVLPTYYKPHPTTYYNYWPQIFPTKERARTEIFGTWHYMVTQTHWRTKYGQFLSRQIRPGEPIDYSEPEPLQMAIWPLEEINYLTFVFTGLGENAFMFVPVEDTIAVTNIRICPCEEGPVLVYDLGIPSNPHNLNELKLVGLTTIKEEVNRSKTCATQEEKQLVSYVAPVLPQVELGVLGVEGSKKLEVAEVPNGDFQEEVGVEEVVREKIDVPAKLTNKSPQVRLNKKTGELEVPTIKALASLSKATSTQLKRGLKGEGQLIELEKRKARLGLRDHKLIDGDIVTILVNGHVLIEAYELTEKIKWFDLPLLKGDNQVVLFAENLGRRVPNTAAMTLESGSDRQEIILKSDLEESAFFVVRVK